jgi:hypothetical protein
MVTGLIIGLIVIVVCILIGALIVQLATKLAAGFKPALGTCVVAVIAGLIAGAIVSWLLQMVIGASGSWIGLIVGFLLNAFIINLIVKRPDGSQMGFGKACLVSLVQYIIYILIGVVLMVVFAGSMMSLLGGVH